ncbi:COR domain-containing protein [Chondrinema litorale]|uniref:leucine-rich repeat domain-containing protein n=1 Tax=Chondrinema litorale TaxID=2994555 RepID=UPI00254385A7|nr:COR domain-containing protein [Chondrinema litorale]UZR95928.1 leucine-rich repeat domain-containing protein [Chondrinema litorale]
MNNDISPANKLIEECLKTKNPELDLGNCGIKSLDDLPKLSKCVHLKTLSFNFKRWDHINKRWIFSENIGPSNNFIKDFTKIKSLTRLISLDLSYSRIQDYSFLDNLKSLESLGLSYNRIQDISFLQNLTNIKYLDLSDNQIQDFSPLQNLNKLQSLKLMRNGIQNISTLQMLSSLEHLDLSRNKIQDISSLQNITNIQHLDLSNNQIQDFSVLQKFINLNSLSLRLNQIQDYSFLQNLTKIQHLDLSDNQIQDVSFLQTISSLRFLFLNYNQIQDIKPLQKLTKLHTLYLIKNRIQDIKPLQELTELEFLNLNENKIRDIKPLLSLIRKGRNVTLENFQLGLCLSKNPITNPPENIVKQGNAAIINYFDQVKKQGEAPLYEVRMMILGQGGAGKTTFANLQVDPDYKVEPKKQKSTLGVIIHRNHQYKHQQVDNQMVHSHLWDFGGQDIQKMLHQFFIAENCLYVIVSDKRAENTNFDYWLQIIQLLGRKSTVIVIENPINSKYAIKDFALIKYRELFPDLTIERQEVNFLYARDKARKRWEALNELIEEKISDLEIVNRKVPKHWTKVRNVLTKRIPEKCISRDEYYKLCADSEINMTPGESDLCLSYFKSLGDVTYFEDRELRNRIILDQNWLIKGLYFILSEKKFKAHNGGKFTRQEAYDKWHKEGYDEDKKGLLLSLLLKDGFDLCYELPYQKDIYIAPLLLQNDKPESWKYETQLYFRYQYGFIPFGLISRLIVRVHEKIHQEKRWETGVHLIDGETFAEIEYKVDPDENQHVIDIKLSGNNCKALLNFIRTEVIYLHKDFENLNAKTMAGCNCPKCKNLMKIGKKPTFHDYKDLEGKILNNKYYISCRQNEYNDVSIGQILGDIIIENAGKSNIDQELLFKLKEMNMSINQIKNENKIENVGNPNIATNVGQQANQSQENQQNQSTNISIDIKMIGELLSQAEMLKEDIVEELELAIEKITEREIKLIERDVSKAEEALKEIEIAAKEKKDPSPKSKNRLKQFINDLSDEKSLLNKGLKLLRKGKDYGVNLANGYNMLAKGIGMDEVPQEVLDAIKLL